MVVNRLSSDFAQIEDAKAKEHPAFAAFVKKMEGRQYGYEAINDAWIWFRSGWDDAKRPPTDFGGSHEPH